MHNSPYIATTRIVFYSIIWGVLTHLMVDLSAMQHLSELSEKEAEEQEGLWEYENTYKTPNDQLSFGIVRNSLELVAAAITRRANVNQSGVGIMPPLVEAMIHDCSPQIIDLLLAHNANPTLRDNSGQTVLQVAARAEDQVYCWSSNAPAYVRYLLRANADVNTIDDTGNTVLHSAVSRALYPGMTTIKVCETGTVISLRRYHYS